MLKERLDKVVNPLTKKYLKEVITSYNSGQYRTAIDTEKCVASGYYSIPIIFIMGTVIEFKKVVRYWKKNDLSRFQRIFQKKR
ncbi:hypothetical protein [Anaeromicropila herbilytica]|uniref:Uncharacterized protein n=1 Tax=Anaeromicropila herbilytica TaxID=2785025 RepID=A0A7R7EK18_9FIRM|nr:hypothetical protein [Anaeromicropila herbilytica]BCN30125.1 hypothetical protein bsdtb5_14200 [Anaeromicropila herbilytica]